MPWLSCSYSAQSRGSSFCGRQPAPEALTVDLSWIRTINGTKAQATWLNFPLVAGKTWKSHDLWQKAAGAWGHEDLDYTVAGVETITVPAGTFDAVKIEANGWWNADNISVSGPVRAKANASSKISVWYAPKAHAIARIEWDADVPSGRRVIVNELTAYKLQ